MKRILFVFITLSLLSISGADARALTHNDAIVISQNLPPYMVAGHTYTVAVTIENTGHTVWDSWRPSGGNYHFGHIQGSWRGSRIEMPYRVLPGERVTLSFTVTAPGCCSDAPFQFQMVEENREWFGQATPLVHIPIYSHAERDSAFVSQEVPTVMIAGYGYRARINMRNTGSGSWGQAGRRLGSNVPGSGRPAIGPGRVDDFVVDADDPNLVTFTVPIVAPPTPGAYDFQYQMLEENVTWFGSFTPNVTVTVVPPPGPPTGAVAVLSADAAFTPASALGDVALKLQNSGFFTAVDQWRVWDPATPLPGLSQLLAYDAAFVYSNNAFGDPVRLGNLLADYIALGRGVVFAPLGPQTNGPQGLAGRVTEFLPYVATGYTSGQLRTLAPALPNDMLLSGVGPFDGGTFSGHNTGHTLAPGSELVATWDSGEPLIVKRDVRASPDFIARVVGVNLFPPSAEANTTPPIHGFWQPTGGNSGGQRLLANAVYWASNRPILSVTVSGSAAWGGTAAVTATVKDFTGSAAPGVTVAFTIGGVRLSSRETDASGRTTLTLNEFALLEPGTHAQGVHAEVSVSGTVYSATGELLVRKGNAAIDWRPRALDAGAPLGPDQLNATASIPGTFAYSPAAGTILSAGFQLLRASFTPDDPGRWTAISGLTANLSVRNPNATYQFASRDLGSLGGSGVIDIVDLNEAGEIVVNSSSQCWFFDGSTWTSFGLRGSSCTATDLSDGGTVVGFAQTPSGRTHAFKYAGGQVSDLGGMGGMDSWALAVNNNGLIAGYYTTPGSVRAFVFQNGEATDLAPTCESSTATAVNDRGQIIGSRRCGGATWEGFRYSEGTFEPLVVPDATVQPQLINAQGLITGRAAFVTTDNVFILDENGMHFPIPPGSRGAIVDLNDYGQFVGFRDNVTGFIGDVDRIVDLAPLHSVNSFNQPKSINNLGTAVGWGTTAAGLLTGLLYDRNATLDLNALRAADSDGAAIFDAVRINDAGQIAAKARINGLERVLLLTPSRVVTALELSAPSSTYGTPAQVAATLTSPSGPVANKPITFSVDGAPAGSATTNASGVGVLSVPGGLAAGTHQVTAEFSGDEAFFGAEDSASLTIAKASVTILVESLRTTYDGTPKPLTVSTIPAVPVELTYNGSLSTPVNAGLYSAAARVVDPNYVDASATGTLTIDKAWPQITWPAPDPIVYGTPLPRSSLNATANIPGTFTYSHQVGDILSGGSHLLTATFTPDDANNYEMVTPAIVVGASITAARAPFTGDEESICLGCERRPYDTTGNLAYQGNGFARAAVGDNEAIAGYTEVHRAEFLNDGRYGHGSSHLTGYPGWVKLDLGREAWITRLRLGRDRLGYRDDRDPRRILIYASSNEANYANQDSSNDAAEYALVLDSWAIGADIFLGLGESAEITLPGVRARYLKFQFAEVAEGAAAIDEIEVFGSLTPPVHAPSVIQDVTKVAPRLTVTGGVFRYDGQAHPATVVATGVLGELLESVQVDYSDGGIVPVHAGSYVATASFGGNGNYQPAWVTATITIGKAPLTATAGDKTRRYGADNPELTGSLVGLMGGDVVTLQLSTAASQSSPAGNYAITPHLADPQGRLSNYDVTIQPGTLTVLPAMATVSVTSDGPFVYDSLPHALTATATGVFGEDLGSVPLTYNGLAAPPIDAGNYGVMATFPGNQNYLPTSTAATMVVEPAPLSVHADDKTRRYGAENPELTGSISGLAAVDAITLQLATTALGASPVGDYEITPSLIDPLGRLANYDVAVTNGSLQIAPATPRIEIAAAGPFVYDGLSHGTAAAAFGVFGEQLSPVTVAYNGQAMLPVNAGTHEVTASFAGVGNYASASATSSLLINRAPLTVTAQDASREFGAANPTFGVSYAGFVPGDDSSNLDGTLTFETAASVSSPVGTYLVMPAGLTGLNYNIAFRPGTLTIVDTTAPEILSVSPSPATLWPVTNKLVPVDIFAVARDAVDQSPSCRVTGVQNSESTTTEDWRLTGPLSVELRASRLGKGPGRNYGITVSCSDIAGNTSTRVVNVSVPHDQRQ